MSMPFISVQIWSVDGTPTNYTESVQCKDTFAITPEEYDAAYMKAFLNIWNGHITPRYTEEEFERWGCAYAVLSTTIRLEEMGYTISFTVGRG
jgi:hypothetical protein